MKAVGLVVEYNPFHNGHLYHIKEAKSETRSEVAVAVMSGSFLQRGEPAIVSKWARTKMALASFAMSSLNSLTYSPSKKRKRLLKAPSRF